MQFLESKCSSNKTPRYFLSNFLTTEMEVYFLVIVFLGDRKIALSVLLTFKTILFARSHWTRFDWPEFNFLLMSLTALLAYSKFVSSARWCIFEFFNKDPKMEPCDSTLYLIVWISDLSLLMVIYWVLSLR